MIKTIIEKDAKELENKKFSIIQNNHYNKLIEKVYRHKIFYAKQLYNGRVTHILPFSVISSCFMGKKIVSMPFDGSYGDVINLDESPVSPELYKAVIEFAKEKAVRYLEIRTRSKNVLLESYGFTSDISLIISEINLNEFIKSKKYQIKKRKNNSLAFSYGIRVEISDDFEDMKSFYKIMSSNMKSYGTPMYPFDYFKELWFRYHKTNELVLIKGIYNNKMVSGLLLLISDSVAVLKYSATIQKYIKKRLYPTMKWFAIDLCISKNCKILNMGTSFINDEGLIKAKEGFGAKTIPLITYSLNLKGENKPLSIYQKRYRLFIEIWKYQPLITSQMLGGVFWKWFC